MDVSVHAQVPHSGSTVVCTHFTLFIDDRHWWRLWFSFLTAINKHNSTVYHLLSSSLSLLCSASLNSPARLLYPLHAPVLQDCGRRKTVSEPPLFIRLSWSEARLLETSLAPWLPAVEMALGRRQEQEDLRDLLSAAVMRCLEPASYQVQQPDKPPVRLHTTQEQDF